MPRWIIKDYVKGVFASVVICLELILGSSLVHASSRDESSDDQPILKNTVLKDLRMSDASLKDIKYYKQDFPSEYDELTQIGSTLCYQGSGVYPTDSAKSEHIPLPGVKREDGKSKIVPATEEPIEQRSLIRNKENRTRIVYPKTADWPYRIHGHMIMKFPNDTYTGSGILVGPNHVLTAAHNLYNPVSKQWAREVFFTPGRDESHYPYLDSKGCILLIHEQWHNKSKEDYDVGMVILDSALGKWTGWVGLLSLPDILLEERRVSVMGYPGDKGVGNFHSTQMWTMDGSIKNMKSEQLFYEIDTYEGQSGSGVLGTGWVGYEGYYIVGIHTGREKEDATENRGIRLSGNKFSVILEWLREYHLSHQAALSIDFLKELPEQYKGVQHRAQKGEAEALYNLGTIYSQGNSDVQKDANKAFILFYHAAQKNHGPALMSLGLCYEEGWGVAPNLLKAISLYQKATIKEVAGAYCKLALLYLEGKGLPKNAQSAIDLFEKAIKGDDAEACNYLAQIYESGLYVNQYPEYAKKLYDKAKALGYISLAKNKIKTITGKETNILVDCVYKLRLKSNLHVLEGSKDNDKITMAISVSSDHAKYNHQVWQLISIGSSAEGYSCCIIKNINGYQALNSGKESTLDLAHSWGLKKWDLHSSDHEDYGRQVWILKESDYDNFYTLRTMSRFKKSEQDVLTYSNRHGLTFQKDTKDATQLWEFILVNNKAAGEHPKLEVNAGKDREAS